MEGSEDDVDDHLADSGDDFEEEEPVPLKKRRVEASLENVNTKTTPKLKPKRKRTKSSV